jgi:hypothetical protein
MDKMRRGVVLFITLSVIAAMLAIVGVLYSYLGKSKDNAAHTQALIQSNILFGDSKKIISNLLKQSSKDKEMRKGILDMLYLAPVTLQEEKGDRYATLFCKPLDSGVNINWLGEESNASMQAHYALAQELFDALVQRYDIGNPSLLLEKIQNAIDPYRDAPESSKAKGQQKMGIISLLQLQQIIREYRFESDEIDKEPVPWEEYFSFGVDALYIDANYISANLLSLLFDIELSFAKEEWFAGGDLEHFLNDQGADMAKYNSKIFAKEPQERIACRVTYGYQADSYSFAFKYIDERALEFEFFGKE